ncbi:uncharacterized protein DAT39_008952 [Clarias magur]|uniref:Uncharacterized protein n=1 Tax=Clarias magur TaxID=1594786 RepID=A0A8J4UPQ6_CLAMG|nr:uncharacterized protein DAT39_008952 [Clarias magur]
MFRGEGREDFFRRMLSAAESSGLIPDVGIDFSLVKYSKMNSAAELENSMKQTLQDIHDRFPDYVQSLGCALAAFKKVPNAVGLGAVAVSIALELIVKTQEEDRDSTMYMMRRVFAEEKASGVRDSMDEYMKRLRMYLHQPTRALEETERLEKQLSEQLTRLKNSMLHDDQMSSRSLKHWTNGAAFHLQMLIHAARLKTQSSTGYQEELQVHVASIESVIDCYQFDLEELLKLYKTYKKTTISLTHPAKWLTLVYFPSALVLMNYWVVKDKDLEKETPVVFCPFGKPGDLSYVDYMFNNWDQLKDLKNYFSDLKENVKDLIIQKAEFKLKKVLPVSDKKGD